MCYLNGKEIKLRHKQHFVANKTDISQQVLDMQRAFLLPKYMK